ncbi:MAG: cytochrome c biogenesis protein CcsA [Bacteroidia bacterium]|nr:cytochrome c biogenesis protein CcsA [Bacteroidia bacterium]
MSKYLKRLDFLFNTRAAGVYILLFAASIGIATFIENDFGTSSAQEVIFKAWWFELLLLLFSICLIVNIIRFRMIQNKKWALVIFHSSMIIILIGAGITRYFSYEGIMHIRENETAYSFLSADSYLRFEVLKDNDRFNWDEHVLFSTLGNHNWNEEYQLYSDLIQVQMKEFIPNPTQEMDESDTTNPTIKLVIGGANGREEYFISQGTKRTVRNLTYNFTGRDIENAVNINYRNDSLTINYAKPLTQMVMATQQLDTLSPTAGSHLLRLRSLYSDGANNFVFGDFTTNGKLVIKSADRKVKNESLVAIRFDVTVNGSTQEAMVYGRKGMEGKPAILRFPGMSFAMSYGSKPITLPFGVKLYEFIMERYPGTNSAASYASEVQLIDQRNNHKEDYRIFMNHILDYDGYRFFQSSFDKDEKGTYLSVNHDFWGTLVSYIGYFLLTLGMLMTFVSKRTRFYQVTQKLKKIKSAAILIIAFLMSGLTHGQKNVTPSIRSIDAEHAKKFSTIIVQDHKGRMKPMHTLTREVLRKISRKESILDLDADQVILSMFMDKPSWISVPMIKLSKHQTIRDLVGVQDDYASFKDFFKTNGEYKLRDEVRRAFSAQPIDRGALEKDLMKIDERVNIASMIYSGRLFKIIPIPNHENNKWVSFFYNEHGEEQIQVPVADRFFPSYKQALFEASNSNTYALPDQIIAELKGYQNQHGSAVIPSETSIITEIILNNLNVFSRLSVFYLLVGICFLALLFTSVFKQNLDVSKVFNFLFLLVVIGFLFHTLGLGMRWYVSGRAPWSNGYESMIYIAWTSSLAGLIFTRKSAGGLAATMVLAGTILLVAKLSYLDPEITPLVPVLRSYWLTIHVSLIAGSYGFLMLGAIIGLINLILMIFLTDQNKTRIKSIVKEMSYISEITLIGGLVMISIGTYLGGVWANESWGRYWGWDAKETWALVTILVYAFILHMRLMPKLTGLYAYNVAKLFGWASVVMTYFGVNYYLSGLHSYAAGDPIPIPNWVYITVISVFIISVLAFIKKKKHNFQNV